MPYSTKADVSLYISPDKLRQLTDDRPSEGEADDSVCARFIVEADGLIDAYIATRYVVPVASPSGFLVALSAKLAAYLIYLSPRRNTGAVPSHIEQQYKDVIAILEKIAAGEMALPGAVPIQNRFFCDRSYKEDRTFRNPRSKGDEDEQVGTFGHFNDIPREF